MELQQGTIVDRYTIERQIGKGGMALVFRARHNQLGTLHAIKVLMVPSQAIRNRLLTEGRVQATLRHPNIVSVTDVIDVGGSPGLVMELVQGPSLDQLLRQMKLTVEQADELARGILAGMAQAHRHGLIHRDLKPANVMLQTADQGFTPKVTDFGLAKVLEMQEGEVGSQTRSNVAMGTPCYMAPEQVRNAKGVDKRADVFSAGALLYELLTGERAFGGTDLFEIFNAITSGRYTPLRELAPDVPERMANAITAALQVDRDARAPDCDALLALWTGEAAVKARSGPWSVEAMASVRSPASSVAAPVSEGTWGDEKGLSNESIDPAQAHAAPTAAPPSSPGALGLSAVLAAVDAGLLESSVGAPGAPVGAPGGQIETRREAVDPSPVPRREIADSSVVGGPSAVRSGEIADSSVVGGPSESTVATVARPARPWPAVVAAGLVLVLVAGGFTAWRSQVALDQPAAEGVIATTTQVAATNSEPTATPKAGSVPTPATPTPNELQSAASAPVATAVPDVALPTAVSVPSVLPPTTSAPKPPAVPAPKPATVAGTTPIKKPVATSSEVPAAAVAPTAATGTLNINSRPWSEVQLDGVAVGRTGNWKREIPAGSHQIRLTTEDGRTVTRSITVAAGDETPFCWNFDLAANCPR